MSPAVLYLEALSIAETASYIRLA